MGLGLQSRIRVSGSQNARVFVRKYSDWAWTHLFALGEAVEFCACLRILRSFD